MKAPACGAVLPIISVMAKKKTPAQEFFLYGCLGVLWHLRHDIDVLAEIRINSWCHFLQQLLRTLRAILHGHLQHGHAELLLSMPTDIAAMLISICMPPLNVLVYTKLPYLYGISNKSEEN